MKNVTFLIILVVTLAIYIGYKAYYQSCDVDDPYNVPRALYESLDQYDPVVRGTQTSPNEIIPGLFLGSVRDANPETLDKLGITAIINLMRLPGATPVEDKYRRLEIPARDNPFYDLAQSFDRTFEFIDSNLNVGNKILVHCHAGVSRSATVVAAYLIKKYNWSTERTLWYIKGIRPKIQPNEGFIKQLIEYAKQQ